MKPVIGFNFLLVSHLSKHIYIYTRTINSTTECCSQKRCLQRFPTQSNPLIVWITWGPLWDHCGTTLGPLGDLLRTTWGPLGDQLRTSSGACLGHIWGLIWGMSGAVCYMHHLRRCLAFSPPDGDFKNLH